jgi:hypothetical protein
VALAWATLGAARASADAHIERLAGVIPDVATAAHNHASIARVANLQYRGGPVLHSNRTHLIFWAPAGSGLAFGPRYAAVIVRFLKRVADASHSTTSTYGLSGQYADASGPAAYESSYGGAVYPTDRLPASRCTEPPSTGPGWSVCLTDAELAREIEHVVTADRLPTGRRDLYFLITPDGLGSCTDSSAALCALAGKATGYCGYHSQTPNRRILYAVIPYAAVRSHCESDNPRPNHSAADPTISMLSHEHSEMVTDPFHDGWTSNAGQEEGDPCLTTFGPIIGGTGARAFNETIDGGHYYLQEEWSNYDASCRPRARRDSVTLSLTSDGASFSFSAHAKDPEGRIVSYLWSFGDGTTAHDPTATHTYHEPGRYHVALRATDSWDNWAVITSTLRATR